MARLLALDDLLSRKLRIAENPGPLRSLAAFLAHSGDSWFWLVGLAIVWWVGNEAWKEKAMVLAVGIVITAVLVLAIKFTVRRQRPTGEWGGIYRKTDPHSFPSGHAARAGVLATLGLGLGPQWFAAILLIWAPLVTFARVIMGVHYVLDVLAGVVFGMMVGGIMLWVYSLI